MTRLKCDDGRTTRGGIARVQPDVRTDINEQIPRSDIVNQRRNLLILSRCQPESGVAKSAIQMRPLRRANDGAIQERCEKLRNPPLSATRRSSRREIVEQQFCGDSPEAEPASWQLVSPRDLPWVLGRLWLLDSNRLVSVRCVKIVRGFELVRGYVVEGSVEPDGVEPVDPGQRCELDVIDSLPGSETADQLGLVEAVDRLGKSVVGGVADGPDGRNRADFRDVFAVAQRRELTACVRVAHETFEGRAA
jgi:hypothetical protein